MFLIPYVSSQITRRSFPLGIVLLVILNFLTFLIPQANELSQLQEISNFYSKSVLPKIELPAFIDYLRKKGEGKQADSFSREIKEGNLIQTLRAMEKDKVFMSRLRQGEFTPFFLSFQWKPDRDEFDAKYGKLVTQETFTERYAFSTEKPSWLTAFTHQFLHGSTSHILGNMVVLILVGTIVNQLVGTRLFILIYLLSGLAAVGSHVLFTQGESGSLVGASGAISGIMGAFAMLLGRRRIPFFYFAFVYFDVIRAPALLALPIWLGNELIQFFWLGNTQVAYGAHFGGLLAGALLALPLRSSSLVRLAPEDANVEAHLSHETRRETLGRARKLASQGRQSGARQAYLELARMAETDVKMLKECLEACGPAEAPNVYREILGQILTRKGLEVSFVLEAFREYMRIPSPPPLATPVLVSLVPRLLRHRAYPEAEQALKWLYDMAPDSHQIHNLIDQAAQAMCEAGELLRARTVSGLIRNKH